MGLLTKRDNIKDTCEEIKGVMTSVGACADHVAKAASAIKSAMPSVKINIDHVKYTPGFRTFVSTAGVVAQGLQAYYTGQAVNELRGIREGIDAQVGLDAPEKFAKLVHKYIQMSVKQEAKDSTKHIFFLYHPDTDWHPDFFDIVEHNPLPNNFYGMSENLDALCVWMMYLRRLFSDRQKWGGVPVFDLLIPGYRPFIIKEPVAFAEQLMPLRLHGVIHNTRPHVMLNLPTADSDQLDLNGIGKWEEAPNWFAVFFQGNMSNRPRVLGGIANLEGAFELAAGTMQLRNQKSKNGSRHGR